VKAVIDTSIFVSTLLAPRGAGAWLMALWANKQFELVISPALEDELIEVLERSSISSRVDRQRQTALFRRLRYDAIWSPGTLNAIGMVDPDDDILLIAALESSAEFIVTRDKKLLKQGNCQGIRIVSLDQFIAILVRNHPR
jgi:putative PIN family toxin of toxin-antitoxin system